MMRGINYYYNNSYKLKKIASYKKILSKRYGIPFTETDSINTCIIDTENANGADTFEEANLLHTDVSFVCVDTSNEMYEKTSDILREKGYKVWKIDLNNDIDTDGIDIFRIDQISSYLKDYYHKNSNFYREGFKIMFQIGIFLMLQEHENPSICSLEKYLISNYDKFEEKVKNCGNEGILLAWKNMKSNFPEKMVKTLNTEGISCLHQLEANENAFTKGNVTLESFKTGKCALFIIPKRGNSENCEFVLNVIASYLMSMTVEDYKPYEIPIHIIYDCSACNPENITFLKNARFMPAKCNMNVSLLARSLDCFMEFAKRLDASTIEHYVGTVLLMGKDVIPRKRKKHNSHKAEKECKIIIRCGSFPSFLYFDKGIQNKKANRKRIKE